MSIRRLPVRPNLDQLKHQARELLRGIHGGDAAALSELKEHHPEPIDPASAKLADAQLALARSYHASSWTRLVEAVQLADAIWRDDLDAVRRLVTRNPRLIQEDVLVRTDSNWGPPMTYAANLGRDHIIRMLHGLGATDLESAAGRAVLQGKVETAKMVHEMAGSPAVKPGALAGPAYTLSVEGTALVLSLGARVRDPNGRRLAPVDVVIETDARHPPAKHAILEMYAQHGLELPTRRRWRCIAEGSICSKNIYAATRRCSRAPSLIERSTLPKWDVAIRSTQPLALPSTGRRCCTCVWNSMRSRSRDGCWIEGWT